MAWATARKNWCLSASAAALAAGLAPRTTSAWPACWELGPCGSLRAPGWSASPAADPRTMRPSPSWTSTAPGGPWTGSQLLPAAAWADGSLQEFADGTLTWRSHHLEGARGLSQKWGQVMGISPGQTEGRLPGKPPMVLTLRVPALQTPETSAMETLGPTSHRLWH